MNGEYVEILTTAVKAYFNSLIFERQMTENHTKIRIASNLGEILNATSRM